MATKVAKDNATGTHVDQQSTASAGPTMRKKTKVAILDPGGTGTATANNHAVMGGIPEDNEEEDLGVEDMSVLTKTGASPGRGAYTSNVAALGDDVKVSFADNRPSPLKFIVKACAKVFITLEVEGSGVVAKYLDLITKAVIVLAIVAYLLSTDAQFQYIPDTCDLPFCNDDLTLCPGYQVCEPVEVPEITAISNFTTYYFTVEYGLKFFTVWAVSSRVAGVVPPDWEEEHENNPDLPVPVYSPWYQTYKFFWRFKNLVDFASIFPAYIQYFAPSGGGSTNFLRTLRLLRLIRVLRLLRLLTFLKNVDVAIELILATLSTANLMLSVFSFFAFVFLIVMGCLMYTVEQGTFTVNAQYPNGAYLKPNDDQTGAQVSSIMSAVQGLYWAILTFTGNGMINPTTDIGKMFQCFTGLCGVFCISIPVAVIGSELDRAYTKQFKILKAISDAKRRKRVAEAAKAAQAKLDAANGGSKRLSAKERALALKHQALLKIRNHNRARAFKDLAARFLRGELPPFPLNSRLYIAQSIIAAEKAVSHAEATRRRALELRKQYEESLAARRRALSRRWKTGLAPKSKSMPKRKMTVEMSAALAVLGISNVDLFDDPSQQKPRNRKSRRIVVRQSSGTPTTAAAAAAAAAEVAVEGSRVDDDKDQVTPLSKADASAQPLASLVALPSVRSADSLPALSTTPSRRRIVRRGIDGHVRELPPLRPISSLRHPPPHTERKESDSPDALRLDGT